MKNTLEMTPQEAVLIGHDHEYRTWNGHNMNYFENESKTSIRMFKTGFYDTVMKDIYEGDLVRTDQRASVVYGQIGIVIWKWEQAMFIVNYKEIYIKFGDYYISASSRKTKLTIIGNIYEQPKLLEEML